MREGERTMYMVKSPANGKLRRYEASNDSTRSWKGLADTWPEIATSDLQDPFEQEYERSFDSSCWSGDGRVTARDVYEILLNLVQKKMKGEI
jgi:hypothetical protein